MSDTKLERIFVALITLDAMYNIYTRKEITHALQNRHAGPGMVRSTITGEYNNNPVT